MLAELGGLQRVLGFLTVDPYAELFCRAVATNSAVEPTLVVISQVSPSLRT